MNKEDLVIGNIYKLNKKLGGNNFIFLFDGIAGTKILASDIINIEDSEYDKENSVYLVHISEIDRITIPSNNEIEWLINCKIVDSFVKRPKIEFDLLQPQNFANDFDNIAPMLFEPIKPAEGALLEEILEYCKAMYPIGTQYKSINSGKTYFVSHEPRIEGQILKGIGDGLHDHGWIYQGGKYAEIINAVKIQIPGVPIPEHINFVNLYSLKELQDAFADQDYDDDVYEQIIEVIKSIKE